MIDTVKHLLTNEKVGGLLILLSVCMVLTFLAVAIAPRYVQNTSIGQLIGLEVAEASLSVPPHAGILRERWVPPVFGQYCSSGEAGDFCWDIIVGGNHPEWYCDPGYHLTPELYHNEGFDENAVWYQCNSN